MILNKKGDILEYKGVKYVVGDPVIATDQSVYENLIGIITEIRDGEDKDTENETPNLYCDFEEPVLECDWKKLEERFSKIEGVPKEMKDIALDQIIMAPSMVMPFSENDMKLPIDINIHIVQKEWAYEDEHGGEILVYADEESAKRKFRYKVQVENDNLYDTIDSDETIFSTYEEGYESNHYCYVSVYEDSLRGSPEFIKKISEHYDAECKLRDFRSQAEQSPILSNLSKEEYQKFIQDPTIPERIQKKIYASGLYWEIIDQVMTELFHEKKGGNL